MAESERTFTVGDEKIEYPTVDTFNMDEAEEFYRVSGVTIEELLLPHPDLDAAAASGQIADLLKKMQAPSFLRGLMNVGYLRSHPDAAGVEVDAAVGGVNIIDALSGYWKQEEDAVPLASTTEPERSSPNGTDGSSTSSGPTSLAGSVPPEDPPGSTGHTRSDTSPVAPRSLSVA